MGYEKEKKSVSSREQEMQTCGQQFGEKRVLAKRGILVEVQHVKAHRTKKEKEKMTQLRSSSPQAKAEKTDEERREKRKREEEKEENETGTVK